MSNKKVKKKRKIRGADIFAGFIVFIIVVGLVCCGVGFKVLSDMLSTTPELNMNAFANTESTIIYDADGDVITEVGNVLRENITYDELPEALVDALMSVEDSRFFEHNGFDIPRFAKAMIENIKSMSFAQGGSTLTMQLVKNSFFTNNDTAIATKSIDRKVQEIYLSIEFENETNKKTIIEYYLNKMNFGATSRGIQKAALYYFGKEVSELSLSECAMLVGTVNSPTAYNPYYHLEAATKRRNTVLDLMEYHGYITADECALAKSINIEDQLVGVTSYSSDYSYPYQAYIDVVLDEVEEITGQNPYDVPMRIYTAMSKKAQQEVDLIQSEQESQIEFPDELMQMAIVSLNNSTGEIVAIGGGRNYTGQRVYNRASQMYNQPGSSVKPFLSYALAFEYLGWSTSHTVVDQPIVYRGTSTQIKNANGQYTGELSLLDAVAKSLNTPAITTLQEIVDEYGYSMVVNYLKNLGFSKVSQDNFDIGYAIGGSSFEVTPIELAAAHGAMINGGVYLTPHTVTKIEYLDGSDPYIPSYSGSQVLSAEASYLVCELMDNNTSNKYYNYMQILNRNYPVYAKTGTSDWGTAGNQYGIPTGSAKDKWMVASTSNYTNVVWLGYDKAVTDQETYWTTAKSQLNLPGKLSKVMLDALEEGDETAVIQPSGVSKIKHIIGTYPYAEPIEGMDESLIVTGLIKDEFNQTVDASENVKLEDISEFAVSNKYENGAIQLTLNWNKYPNEEQLTVAPDTKEFTLEIKGITITGNRVFDWSWVYGAVKYRARIENESGEVIAEFTSDTEESTQTIDVLPGSKIKACGFYAYEKEGSPTSNEICTEITLEDVEVEFPAKNATQKELDKWIEALKAFGIEIETKKVESDDVTSGVTNSIKCEDGAMNGLTYTVMQLSKKTITLSIYEEKTITIPQYIGMSKQEFLTWALETFNNKVVDGSGKEYVTSDKSLDGKVAYVEGLSNLGYKKGSKVKASQIQSFVVYYYTYKEEVKEPEKSETSEKTESSENTVSSESSEESETSESSENE